jgi:hypothetical protein
MTDKPEMILWVNDHHGIYVPQEFAKRFANRAQQVIGVTDEDWAILDAGPGHELYWDVWNEVEQNALVRDGGTTYRIYNNGDCWLVPADMVWDDKNETFVWPEDQPEDVELATIAREETTKEQPTNETPEAKHHDT